MNIAIKYHQANYPASHDGFFVVNQAAEPDDATYLHADGIWRRMTQNRNTGEWTGYFSSVDAAKAALVLAGESKYTIAPFISRTAPPDPPKETL